MVKKIVMSVVGLLIIAFIGFFIFLKIHPPLTHMGMSYNPNNSSAICIELNNKGFSDIELQQVWVNDNEIPKKILLGTSRSNGVISIGLVKKPPKGVQFDAISAYPIKTPTESYQYMQFDKIRHYGIVVYGKTQIRNVVIKYTYLGIPFKNKVQVGFN